MQFFSSCTDMIRALATGVVVGAIFGLFKLPVPAPQVSAGIAGVVGLWLGFALISILISRYFRE
jgi:XapX domain-containing protein